MALVSCWECNAQISSSASSCPKCGAPVHGTRPRAVAPTTFTRSAIPFGSMFCTQCHAVGTPRTENAGNGCVAVALLLLFIFPGIIYLVWMSTTERKLCANCGSPALVPLNSERAREHVLIID